MHYCLIILIRRHTPFIKRMLAFIPFEEVLDRSKQGFDYLDITYFRIIKTTGKFLLENRASIIVKHGKIKAGVYFLL